MTGLTHKAVLHLHGVDDARAIVDDGVLTDDTRTDIHIGLRRRDKCAVAQPCRSIDLAVVAHQSVGHLLGIDNLYAVAKRTTVGHRSVNLFLHHAAKRFFHLAVVEVAHHESGKLTVETIEEKDVAITHFIEHGDEVALSIGGTLGSFQRTDVGDVTFFTYGVVVDVIADILDETVVAYFHIAERGVVDARVLIEITGDFHVGFKYAQSHVAIKLHIMQVYGLEVLIYEHIAPVFGPTAIILKERYLLTVQFAVCHK